MTEKENSPCHVYHADYLLDRNKNTFERRAAIMYYTIKDILTLTGMTKSALQKQWETGKGPKRIADGIVRIPKADALAWAEERARNTRPVYAPMYERAAQFMRMDLHLDQGAYAV
jgi:hypothetical protein